MQLGYAFELQALSFHSFCLPSLFHSSSFSLFAFSLDSPVEKIALCKKKMRRFWRIPIRQLRESVVIFWQNVFHMISEKY